MKAFAGTLFPRGSQSPSGNPQETGCALHAGSVADTAKGFSPQLWIGSLGAIGTAALLSFVLTLSTVEGLPFPITWGHPLAVPFLTSLPAVVGFLLNVRQAQAIRTEAFAVGTSLGWVLFMVFAASLPLLPSWLTLAFWAVTAALFMWATQKMFASLAGRLAPRFSTDRAS